MKVGSSVSCSTFFQDRSLPFSIAGQPSSARALAIPEILEQVLGHLGQSCLRFTATLVCRQWHSIGLPLIIPQDRLLWNRRPRVAFHDHRNEVLIGRLKRNQVIDCKIAPLSANTWTSSNTLQERQIVGLQVLCSQLDLDIQSHPQLTFYNSGTLESKARVASSDLDTALIMSGLLDLVSLRVSLAPESSFPIDLILQHCPNLLYLSVLRDSPSDTTFHWRRRMEPSVVTFSSNQDANATKSEVSYPLRTLELQDILIESRILDSLLDRCQQLCALYLSVMLVPRAIPQALQDRVVSFNTSEKILNVIDRCPRLDSIHLSRLIAPMSMDGGCSQVQYLIQTLAKQATDWSFMAPQLTPKVWESLRLYLGSRITRLEIVTKAPSMVIHGTWATTRGHDLHEFLCAAPCLQHLIATGVIYYVEYMDFNGILDDFGSTLPGRHSNHTRDVHQEPSQGDQNSYIREQYWTRSIRERKVWACRDLRTLHLNFGRTLVDSRTVENARVLFGYLARVCPRLEDVWIVRNQLDLSLRGGFCLLGDLTSLRRLRIDLSSLEKNNRQAEALRWMNPSKRSKLVKRQDRQLMKKIKLESIQHLGQQGSIPRSPASRPVVLDDGWFGQHGRLAEVVAWLEQNEDSVESCWPELEVLQLRYYSAPPTSMRALQTSLQKFWPKAYVRVALGAQT
ncbi:hypothetical protein BGZ83_000155 [Gryganskiella cystojenkinii]|nr:hypothetical protein BGZ83_000155 [Gryganskiella cystojenkinii]